LKIQLEDEAMAAGPKRDKRGEESTLYADAQEDIDQALLHN